MSAEALRIEGLSKNFGGLQILRDLSTTVEAGDKVAIIGPNGAGKTTLLNLISGELPPSGGRIFVFGRETTHMPSHRRAHLGVARSFQTSRLFPYLNVLDNLLLALRGTRPSRFEIFRSSAARGDTLARAQAMLESLDLWRKKDTAIGALAYGEQRRLEIALSLASEPRILLLDEPTAGLAIADIPGFVSLVKTLARNTTLLFIAHDMDVVYDLANRILVLYFGQFIAQGTPEEIQQDPKVREIYLGSAETS